MTTEEQRARRREQMRRYREKHRERLKPIRHAESQRYWRENKEKIVAKRKVNPAPSRDRERVNAYAKSWRDEHPERVKAAQKRYNSKNPRRGLARQRVKREQQAGRPKPTACEICSSSDRRIAFDHCHRTGKFRGWICTYCNVILGYINDDPDHLRKLIAYLEATNKVAPDVGPPEEGCVDDLFPA